MNCPSSELGAQVQLRWSRTRADCSASELMVQNQAVLVRIVQDLMVQVQMVKALKVQVLTVQVQMVKVLKVQVLMVHVMMV